MSVKEDILNEIEIIARSIGIDSEKARNLSAEITLLLKDYNITEETTDLVVRESDEDVIMVRKFLMSKKVKGCTDRTIEFYTKELQRALPKLQKSLRDITVDDIRWFIADKEFNGNCSRVTCSNTLRVLSSLFQFMRDEGYIQENPVMKFGAYKVPKQKKEAFTEYEVELMRGLIKEPKAMAIFEMLLSTGCRVSELCQIKQSEISGYEILVHGKGQKDRIVRMNTRARVTLTKYINSKCQESLESVWLFPKKEYRHKCLYPSEHIDKCTVESIIRKIGRTIDIEAYPHKFRRTCATWALKRGMDLMYVSKMLGHDSVQTTQIYLDLDEETMKEQHRKYVV